MIHSKSLEETVLWKVYQEKIVSESTRASWVKEVCGGMPPFERRPSETENAGGRESQVTEKGR